MDKHVYLPMKSVCPLPMGKVGGGVGKPVGREGTSRGRNEGRLGGGGGCSCMVGRLALKSR